MRCLLVRVGSKSYSLASYSKITGQMVRTSSSSLSNNPLVTDKVSSVVLNIFCLKPIFFTFHIMFCIARPNCALDRRTILCMYVPGFQR